MQRDQAISYSNIGTWSEAKLEREGGYRCPRPSERTQTP
jgi:hypothetical protein